MMRRALEEDQYSALGSVVDTESSDDEDNNEGEDMYGGGYAGGDDRFRWNHRPKRSSSSDEPPADGMPIPATSATNRLDRRSIRAAMRKHLRTEGMKSVRNFDESIFVEECNKKRSMSIDAHPYGEGGMEDDQERAIYGRRIGKRRKKKKKRVGEKATNDGAFSATQESFGSVEVGGGEDAYTPSALATEDENEENAAAAAAASAVESSVGDVDMTEEGIEDPDREFVPAEEESSIFGQTAGSSNATWVECDRCKKWRRLRGVIDARKLPSRWYCSMNKTDPDRARCSAPEEEYESPTTPESRMDQRTRRHLRVWVRRLHCNEAFENRQRSSKKRAAAIVAAVSGVVNNSTKEPYEWIRCCNPSCGKWRMLLRSMDASSVIDRCKNGEWYCVMNTWDEKAASCGAAQENLPAVGCPPWVMVD